VNVERSVPEGLDQATAPSLWEQHSDWWQDEFTDGADPEYEEQILPLARQLLQGYGSVLDLGAGEGQIARLAAGDGASVVGVDPTWSQMQVAHERAGGPSYVVAGAAELPHPDDSFDAVIACLVFEHIDPLEPAVAEVARVLRPGGRFAFFLNHPLLQTPGSGWIDDHMVDPPEQYWRLGEYLVEASTVEEVQKDVLIPFVHRPLGRYVNTLAAHDLVIREMHEPSPPQGFLDKAPSYAAAAAIPRLLVLVCERISESEVVSG
jgi:SAM-dependent methyltransferase